MFLVYFVLLHRFVSHISNLLYFVMSLDAYHNGQERDVFLERINAVLVHNMGVLKDSMAGNRITFVAK